MKAMDPKEKIILALDVDHFEEAQRLVLEFKDHVGMFKVGKQLFTHCGPKIVDFIKLKGSKVFLDLKYHDIPNTVAKASVEAARLGVDMLNVHTAGGLSMMREARISLHDATKEWLMPRPKIIGVTVLTSMDDEELRRVGIEMPVRDLVRKRALLAKEAGLDGVVASGEELEIIRETCGRDFVIVTPGVRIDEKKDDQKRVTTPKNAIEKGATYIVLGRAITASKTPVELLDQVISDIRNVPSH